MKMLTDALPLIMYVNAQVGLEEGEDETDSESSFICE
jgi:hypothetical protein